MGVGCQDTLRNVLCVYWSRNPKLEKCKWLWYMCTVEGWALANSAGSPLKPRLGPLWSKGAVGRVLIRRGKRIPLYKATVSPLEGAGVQSKGIKNGRSCVWWVRMNTPETAHAFWVVTWTYSKWYHFFLSSFNSQIHRAGAPKYSQIPNWI